MAAPWQDFLEAPQSDPERAAVHVLPIPLEQTVSYGGGTAAGPAAILEASYQLELYDREFDCEPGLLYGVHTLAPVVLGDSPLQAIEERVARDFRPGVLLAALGGEHSLTAPIVRALCERVEQPLTVVQLDAHADLRDDYQGDPASHACVARRLLEIEQVDEVLQLGIRSLCREEAEFIKNERRVRTWFADDLAQTQWKAELAHRLAGKTVYVTLDIDGLDPSLVPATGTPEPGGLSFNQALEILRLVASRSQVVAFDCVELAPIEGHHASNFVAAKLVYKAMNIFLARRIRELKA